jgi:hypothetical protein
VVTKGLLYIREEQAPNNFLAFKVTAVSNETGYTKLTVSNVASSATSPFANTDKLLVAYSLTGDKGDAGSLTGPGSSTDNAIVRYDGVGGNLTQDSSVLIADDGSMIISGSSSGDMLRITQTGAGNALVVEDSTNPDSTPFVVDASGNVSIGTASPSQKLDVNGNVKATGYFIGSDPSYLYQSATDTVSLRVGADGPYMIVGKDLGSTALGTGNASGALALLTSGSERMRIDSSGNVGIGISIPAVPLHISSATPSMRLTDTDDNSDAQIGAAAGGLLVFDADIGNEVAGSAILFRVDGGSEKMRIDSSGRVGIGRTPTTNLLEVAGTIESTTGGFKFPDGSTQTKSAGHGLSAMIALGMA